VIYNYYVEIVDEDGSLVAGATVETRDEAAEYILKQIAAGVTEETDSATIYNCYTLVSGERMMNDVEWTSSITNCYSEDFLG
jgi:hypothetical protein